MNKVNLLVVLFLSLGLGFSIAQEDSTKTDEDWKWHWDEEDEWEEWVTEFGFKESRPALSLQYGLADLSRTDIQTQFVDPSLLELKLGYVKDRKAWGTDYIIKHNYKYIYISNESNTLAGKNAVGTEVESNMWRFGFGRLNGYGYKLSEHTSIIPYYASTLNWSSIDFKYPDVWTVLPDPDQEILDLYDESFRFGTSSEGGVRVKVIDNFMVDVGYERSIVFQRHLFWKWASSTMIEMTTQALLDGFISKVFESSPAAGPVVNFLLKNALAYGLYELRQDTMNWPFSSEAPIAHDQFKFGVTFVF